eukprot:1310111-Amphidinium_carterae.1
MHSNRHTPAARGALVVANRPEAVTAMLAPSQPDAKTGNKTLTNLILLLLCSQLAACEGRKAFAALQTDLRQVDPKLLT